MWLRSDKRELRIRNQPKTKFLNNHRKKRKRNQYSRTIKLMKNEKKASVLSTSQYSDDLTMYNDKAIKAKKHNVNKKIFDESLSFSTESKMNQFGPISYDLNTLDIDLDIRTTSSITSDENLEYDASSEHFQTLNAQYDFDCNYAKSTSEIHAVADLILKRKFISKVHSIKLQVS